jgi:hypothetical protein
MGPDSGEAPSNLSRISRGARVPDRSLDEVLRTLEGCRVGLALAGGDRIDDCHLIAVPRAGATTVWVFEAGRDHFLSPAKVIDAWEVR